MKGAKESRRPLAALLLFALLALPGSSQDRYSELIAESRFVEALDDVSLVRDPLERAQGELWVRHNAGDLHGALAVGTSELKAHPKDPFLLEQSAFIALSLHRTELAAELLRRLRQLSTSGALDSEAAAAIVVRVGEMDQELQTQLSAADARDRALGLARRVVLLAAGALGIALAFLAWSTGRSSR